MASHLLSRPIVSWLKGTSDSHRLQLASFLTHLCACSKTLCISGHTYRDQGSAWSQQHRLTLTDSFLTKNTAWLVSRTKPLAYSLRDSSRGRGGRQDSLQPFHQGGEHMFFWTAVHTCILTTHLLPCLKKSSASITICDYKIWYPLDTTSDQDSHFNRRAITSSHPQIDEYKHIPHQRQLAS